MKIEHTVSPTSENVGFLTQKIKETILDFEDAYPFAFFMRKDKNEIIIASCSGSVDLGTFISIN